MGFNNRENREPLGDRRDKQCYLNIEPRLQLSEAIEKHPIGKGGEHLHRVRELANVLGDHVGRILRRRPGSQARLRARQLPARLPTTGLGHVESRGRDQHDRAALRTRDPWLPWHLFARLHFSRLFYLSSTASTSGHLLSGFHESA